MKSRRRPYYILFLVILVLVLTVGYFVADMQWDTTRTAWRLNGEMVEIDLTSFRLKHVRYVWFIKRGEVIEDSPISLMFPRTSSHASEVRWQWLYVRKSKSDRLYHGRLLSVYSSICSDIASGFAIDEESVRNALETRKTTYREKLADETF